MFLQTVIETVP